MKYLLMFLVVITIVVTTGCSTTTTERVIVESSYKQADGLLVHTDEEIGNLTKESFREGVSYGVWLAAEMCLTDGQFTVRGRLYTCKLTGQTF